MRRLLLLALLCAYGLSIKLTFLAFIPGLAALVFVRLRLWERARIRDLAGAIRRDLRLCLAALPVLLVFSQVWLFAFNTHHYGSWNGPPEFTHRHGQHDGVTGATANLVRYGMQAFKAGYVTVRYAAGQIGFPRPTDVANEIYQSYAEPIFGSAGATREPFYIVWAQHEDFAWFGPLGAAILFLFVPFALRKRKREAVVFLLPALGYLLIVAAKISWMPWSGRFFTPFMVALAPALAIGLESIRSRSILASLGLLACFQLTVTKVVDFERYLIPAVRMIREDEPLTPGNLYHHAAELGQNRCNPEVLAAATEYAPRRSLLEKVPPESRIGLYNVHHRKDFRFFHVRPDLAWRPLNFSRGHGERDLDDAVAYFLDSELDYLVIHGRFQGRPPAPVLARDESPPLTLLGKPETP